MRVSEHANYLLNEYGRLQFDYAAYCKPDGESLRNEARNNLETYIAELEAAQRWKATRLEWHDIVSRAIKSEYYEPTAESTETGERAGDSEGSEG
jgi:hypothetical protein